MLDWMVLRVAVIAALATLTTTSVAPAPPKALKAFASDQEIADLFKRWAEKYPAPGYGGPWPSFGAGPPGGLLSYSVSAGVVASAADTGLESAREPLFNLQHAGVDEGSIVQRHGDHLVILRRGRLFTVRVGDLSGRGVVRRDAHLG